MSEALTGNLSTDRKTGAYSARLREAGFVRMNFDVASAGTVSDHPLEVFWWEGGAPVTFDRLRREAGKGGDAAVEEVTAAQFFRAAAAEPDWKSEAELATARRYQALVRLLEESLTDLAACRVGEIDITAFVLGRGAGGNWLGLKTRLVET